MPTPRNPLQSSRRRLGPWLAAWMRRENRRLGWRRWTQTSFAREVGTSQASVWRWLRGRDEPTELVRIARICRLTGAHPALFRATRGLDAISEAA